MTPAGRRGKLCRLGLAVALVAAVVVAGAGSAAATEQVVVDRYTGLAISGYDAVAYFTDGRPVPGRGEHEYAFAGVVWRFRNEGNRAAFIADPAVYMPRFSGYDPVGIGRGVAIPGHPRLWHLADQRLYLFYSTEDQETFVLDTARAIAAADRKWPALRHQLVP